MITAQNQSQQSNAFLNQQPKKPPIIIPGKNKNSKLLKIAGVILVAITLLTSGVFAFNFYQQKTIKEPILPPPPEPPIKPSTSPTIIIPADWKTYTNKGSKGFELKHPKSWRVEELSLDYVKFYDQTNNLILSVYTLDFSKLGIHYCGAYPDDAPRCERFNVNNNSFLISWGTDNESLPNAMISGLSLNLHQVNSQTKSLFRQVLATFKFVESSCKACDQNEYCLKRGTKYSLSLDEAINIAQISKCLEQGKLKETHFCNQSTGTWWIDLDIKKPGCNPACVVNVETKTAEVNWRCTGLLP